jgi:UDP-GlcNAc:undecaprenyl-phosphate GlcNAc-1-phosphate transferase
MTAPLAAVISGAGAILVTAAISPAIIRLAHRLRFYDRPAGYKQHARPTPYLGGLAVLLGMLAAIAMTGTMSTRYIPVVVGMAAVWALGTLDDRWNLHPLLRVAVEAGLGAWLWAAGVGWELVASDALNLGMTIGWVVLVVNAFNLMDNMDGTGSTTGAVAAAGLGIFAVSQHDPALSAIAFALAGALLGFLPSNLARPARIFLGDGGSMVVGFVVAAVAMSAVPIDRLGFGAVLCAALITGLPLLDTAMVVVSRRRRGEPLLMGGRDHLTHRLLVALRSPRLVCALLALTGIGLAATSLIAGHFGKPAVLWVSTVYVALAISLIWALERLGPRPTAVRAAVQANERA